MSTEQQRKTQQALTELQAAYRAGQDTGALYYRYVQLGGLLSLPEIEDEEKRHPEKKRKVVKVVKS